MACAALSLMEEDIKLRNRVYSFLQTPDEKDTAKNKDVTTTE